MQSLFWVSSHLYLINTALQYITASKDARMGHGFQDEFPNEAWVLICSSSSESLLSENTNNFVRMNEP